MSDQTFEGWAIVEMLGHKKLAGKVSEQQLAGSALVRVDVPATEHPMHTNGFTAIASTEKPGYTKFIGVGSIYCITPCTEEIARAAATQLERWNDPIPVQLQKLIGAGSGASEEIVHADVGDDHGDDHEFDDNLDDEERG